MWESNCFSQQALAGIACVSLFSLILCYLFLMFTLAAHLNKDELDGKLSYNDISQVQQ